MDNLLNVIHAEFSNEQLDHKKKFQIPSTPLLFLMNRIIYTHIASLWNKLINTCIITLIVINDHLYHKGHSKSYNRVSTHLLMTHAPIIDMHVLITHMSVPPRDCTNPEWAF